MAPDPPVSSIKPGEALLAVTGLGAVLARKFRRPTVVDMERSQGLDRKIRQAVRQFVDAPGFERRERNPDPEFDYPTLLDQLSAALEPAHLADCMSRFGEMQDLGLDYIGAAQPALTYLRTRLPTSSRRTLANAKPITPSSTELGTFRRVYTVATEPLSVLRNLNAGVLTYDEVTSLETMFPTLYAAMRTAFAEAVAARLERSPGWEFSSRKEALAQVFLKTNTLDLDLAADIQKSYAASDQQQGTQAPKGGPRSQSADSFLTQAQKVAAGQKSYG